MQSIGGNFETGSNEQRSLGSAARIEAMGKAHISWLVTRELDRFFINGDPIPSPTGVCGPDPDPVDNLDCESYSACE